MADISTELARILSAIYGEDVRGSIHDAIEKINDVSEVVLTTGTAVTGPSSSSTGFYDDSLYLNTDTFELWKCTGVNTWASQGILKGEAGDDGNGIVSIVKTSTSGLVDTYTITYTNGTTSTFTVTNGEDGANGNKWYRGTGISGKAALPTVYTGSGVADANSGDMFLNPSEGAVYSCVTGGVPTVATWQYEMTLSGGSGGTSDYPDLTNKPSINGHTLLGNQTGADLGLANSSDIPTVDQTYNATSSNAQSGKAVAEAIGSIHGGGMFPYLYIDSEAGATVTVTQPDGTTITPTAAGSGHWECELTGGYGTYIIHSVLSGQGDATLSLAVDTVKEYHVTDTHYDYTINVTAPSGSSVRITGGGETYTGTGTGSSQAFAVHSPSTTYTVAVTMDGNTKSETITSAATSGQSGSVTIAFGTINVTVAADFVTAGSTITCAKTGVNTISKAAASTLTFRVPETGEYTISGTVSGTPYSTTATVTALGTPVSTLLQTTPEGSTVTPTDDIPTWLACGGLSSTGYTTLSQVLADSTTLLALMSDNNAVDYLVRSTTWASGVTADNTAMTDIGANNYCADTLLANENWCKAIGGSAYIDSVLNVKVPTNLSNGQVIYSSQNETYTAVRAFNGTKNWVADGIAQPPHYIGYRFNTKQLIKYVIGTAWGYSSGGFMGKSFKVQASDDNSSWTDLTDIITPTSIEPDTTIEVPLNSNNTKYQYYRLISTVQGTLGTLQFYGREDV